MLRDVIDFIERYAGYGSESFSDTRLADLAAQVASGVERYGVDALLRRLSDAGDALLLLLVPFI